MQLKALTAIVSIAFTLGVQAAPNAFDRAAGVKDVLKRSHHGMDMSQLSKRAMALVAKKRDSNHHRRAGKHCIKPNTTPSTPALAPTPESNEATPTPQQPQTTPNTPEPVSSPAPEPTKDNNDIINDPTTRLKNNVAVGTDNTALDSESQSWLDEHNTARANHGASALTWSNDLANVARDWASKCVWEHGQGDVPPSLPGWIGQNLAAGTGDGFGPGDSVWMWMNETDAYEPKNPKYSHFTQVVWKATTQLGCAIVTCNPLTPIFNFESRFAVCEYYPGGNIDVKDQYDKNVECHECTCEARNNCKQ